MKGKRRANQENAAPRITSVEALEPRLFLAVTEFVDVAVVNLRVPAAVQAESTFTVEYDLVNRGNLMASSDSLDTIFLRASTRPGIDDKTLASPEYSEDIEPGESVHMAVSVALPRGVSGTRHISVFANVFGMLEEGTHILNNTATKAINILPPPPADLVPVSLTPGATVLMPGNSVHVVGQVRNVGVNPALGGWADALYVSQDAKLDSRDILLTTCTHAGDLDPGATYQVDFDATVPPEALGAKYLILKVDQTGFANETAKGRTNNALKADVSVVGVRFKSLASGTFLARSHKASLTLDCSANTPGAVLDLELSGYKPLPFQPDLTAPDTELVQDWLVTPGKLKTVPLSFDLSGLPYGTYTLSAELDLGGGHIAHEEVDVTLVDEAVGKSDKLGDTIGGPAYEVFNMEAGRAGDAILFRVGTNYGDDDADFRIVPSGAAVTGSGALGIAGGSRLAGNGSDLTMGALYRGVEFAPGEVVETYPALIDDWEQEIEGQSFLDRMDHAGPGQWDYDLFGGVLIDALGDVSRGLKICWSMYCSNDWVELPVSKTTPQSDWVSKNLRDAELVDLVDQRIQDYSLSRTDMIDIIRQAASDDGQINAIELQDLKTILRNTDYLGIDDSVRVLSEKIVNGDPANRSFKQESLGNMRPGSGKVQVENLIQKWFKGADHPASPYIYHKVEGSLLQDGISYEDVRQGHIGDCYWMAGLAETAYRSPDTIKNMFRDNGDGTWTVSINTTRGKDYVTVDSWLPTDADGKLVYAGHGARYTSSSNELWPALAEKAYVQLTEAGTTGSIDRRTWRTLFDSNAYETINGGLTNIALKEITGRKTSLGTLSNPKTVIDAYDAGHLISLATKKMVSNANLVPSHGYALVGYEPSGQTFTLYNPLNTDGNKPGLVALTWDEMRKDLASWGQTVEKSLVILEVV